MAKRTQSSRALHDQRPRKGRKNIPGNSRDRTGDLRIVGGKYRGRKLSYQPFCMEAELVTRPMKDRVREAIFNLVGLEVQGRYAIDLFAGTGALGLEAISRGAVGATFIEKHVPTARVVEANITNLEVRSITELKATSAFLWTKRDMANAEFGIQNAERGPSTETHNSWIVFCSPPYAFYHERLDDMLELIKAVIERAPEGSLMVVEADDRFDFNLLPGGPVGEKRTDCWQVRAYPPAVVGVWRG